MFCPVCHSDNVSVVDVVKIKQECEIYRKRKCNDCKHRFCTIEFEVEFDERVKREWNKNHRK